MKGLEALKRITRDDTEHGKHYYLADEVDALLAQPEERNFCERCGKRLGQNDWDVHTCTPPQLEQEPVAPEDTVSNRRAIKEDPGSTIAIMQRMQRTINRLKAQPEQEPVANGYIFVAIPILEKLGINRAVIDTIATTPPQPKETERDRDAFMTGYEAAQSDAQVCNIPPRGWSCTRQAGHDGPCASVANDDLEIVNKAMQRLAEQPAQQQEPDPCPGCLKGIVCKTPSCGRLKLPVDHPFFAAPQRKPMTDEQRMIEMVDAAMVATRNIVPRITRSQCRLIIEAAHGIKEKT